MLAEQAEPEANWANHLIQQAFVGYLLFAWPVLFPVCRRFKKIDMLPTLMGEDTPISHSATCHS